MNILNLASNDYANMSHNNANTLRSINVKCDDLTLNNHIFGYKSQSQRATPTKIIEVCNDYDVIQIFHSCPTILKLVNLSKFKGKIIVYHTGSRYRENPEAFNELFNPIVHATFTDHTEFMHLGGHNIHYIAPHVEINKDIFKPYTDKLIIGHYPSSEDVKGTKEIIEMLEPFKDYFDIRISTDKVTHEENLKRISECHIYIELFKPELNGKPYGCYGVTAFEASSLGCIVVTNNLHENVYSDVYGNCPFYITNTKDSFISMIDTIKDFVDINNFQSIMLDCYNDLIESHSIEATGKRILSIIK